MATKKTVNSFKELDKAILKIIPDEREVVGGIQNIIYGTAKTIVNDVKRDHPWEDRSGLLTNSHKAKKLGKTAAKVYATSRKYASYLYYGTKRHFIAPRKAKVLAWGDGNFPKGHWVSGVWAGKERTGRAKGTRSTPKNTKELRWLDKAWNKRRRKTLARIIVYLEKSFVR